MLRIVEEFHKTDVGRQRRANEDNLFARAPLYVVADGMGGAQAGEVASGIAVDAFEPGLPGDGSPEEQLSAVIRDANDRIHELAQSDVQRAGMGTTLTAAVVGDHEVSIAHVGDSRAYLWRGGELQALTRDHSLVEELVRRGKLTEEQAAEHPQRSIITRALGPEAEVEVETQTRRAQDGDVFLLCSDGLTSMVDEGVVARILSEASSLAEAGERLIEAANEAGGRDNITVVLFRVEDLEGGAAVEQPTEVRAAAAGQATRLTSTPDTRERPTAPKRTAPRPRREGPAPAAPRGRGRVRALFGALIALALVGAVIVGAVLFVRANYFVGEDDRGFVTVYRGIDRSPLGIELFSEHCRTPVFADAVPAARRKRVLDRSTRSKEDALDLVGDLYREQLGGAPDPSPRRAVDPCAS